VPGPMLCNPPTNEKALAGTNCLRLHGLTRSYLVEEDLCAPLGSQRLAAPR
jgi:hypothetical protein